LHGKSEQKTMSTLTPEQIAEITEFGEAEAHANGFLCALPEVARPFRLVRFQTNLFTRGVPTNAVKGNTISRKPKQ
jgi:hypothetical protein